MLRTLSLLSILTVQALSLIGLQPAKPAHEQSALKGVDVLVTTKGDSEKSERNRLV